MHFYPFLLLAAALATGFGQTYAAAPCDEFVARLPNVKRALCESAKLQASPARRVNANGVDLNRNFRTPNWQRDAKIYWEQRIQKRPASLPRHAAIVRA